MSHKFKLILIHVSSSRTVEGALIGALFLAGSTMTKKYMINLGIEKNIAAICGGMVGGVAQAVVMTPAGMIFTALNTGEDETTLGICKRIIQEKGVKGMYVSSSKRSIIPIMSTLPIQ